MKFRDTLERMVWTAVSVVLGSASVLVGALVTDANLSETAYAVLTVGATAVANALTLAIRYRTDSLPNPGGGLPGLPTGLEG